MDDREASGERAETRVDPLAAFRAVVENLDQSYFVASADYGRFHYVSPAAERLWGRPPDALVADPTAWLDWLHPDDRDEVARFVAEHAGAERYEREFRIVRPDGEVRWLLAKAFAWRAGEMPPLVIGYQQDITDRKERDLSCSAAARRTGPSWTPLRTDSGRPTPSSGSSRSTTPTCGCRGIPAKSFSPCA
jgi:PAS domain S-box-containing protein